MKGLRSPLAQMTLTKFTAAAAGNTAADEKGAGQTGGGNDKQVYKEELRWLVVSR